MKRIWLLSLLTCLAAIALAADTTGIVAYSDTATFADTCTAPAASTPISHFYSFSASTDDWNISADDFFRMFSGFKDLVFSNGWLFALALLFFVALPFAALLLLILVVVLLLRRNSSQKSAQKTEVNNTPDCGEVQETSHSQASNNPEKADNHNDGAEELRQLGVRRCCIGAGLLLLCIFIDSRLGMGIGCLLICIGISHIINGRKRHRQE
ncbi:MAG: DUF6249 domain-containing protein [Prevotella sp.]